jgi:diaminopimelate epimerase
MSSVFFTKAVACGNDFLIVDSGSAPADLHGFSRRICDRHSGVGADGVEWITEEDGSEADLTARLINADGSEAEISGNGTRCVAAWWCKKNSATRVRIRTGAGVKTCALTSHGDDFFEFEMKIGEPKVGDERMLKISSGGVHGREVSMGNPHYVVFVESFDFPWQAMAQEIQSQSVVFPEGVNVEYVRKVSEHEIESRFYERGAGETQSSGTGSCASAVAAIAAGFVKSPVTVKAVGGSQTVRWDGQIFLRGPAQLVCEGQFWL